MSVDFPAPFSPTIACTSPRATRSSMSRLATTPGNRLVMPRSSTAYGTPPAGAVICAPRLRAGGPRPLLVPPVRGRDPPPEPGRRGPPGARRSTRRPRRMMSHAGFRRETATGRAAPNARAGPERGGGPGHVARARPRGVRCDADPLARTRVTSSRRRRNLDLAVDDLLAVVVDLGLDVVDEAAGGGQADALGLQVADDVLAALDLSLGEVVDERLDAVVDPLEHRRHDHGLQGRVVDGLVLVGVDTDRPLVRGGGRLEHTETGTAGDLEDDVGSGVVHALSHDLPLGRVAEA